jgi:hypothetical protein
MVCETRPVQARVQVVAGVGAGAVLSQLWPVALAVTAGGCFRFMTESVMILMQPGVWVWGVLSVQSAGCRVLHCQSKQRLHCVLH